MDRRSFLQRALGAAAVVPSAVNIIGDLVRRDEPPKRKSVPACAVADDLVTKEYADEVVTGSGLIFRGICKAELPKGAKEGWVVVRPGGEQLIYIDGAWYGLLTDYEAGV